MFNIVYISEKDVQLCGHPIKVWRLKAWSVMARINVLVLFFFSCILCGEGLGAFLLVAKLHQLWGQRWSFDGCLRQRPRCGEECSRDVTLSGFDSSDTIPASLYQD